MAYLHGECYECVNAVKVESLTERMARQEAKTDNIHQMVLDIKSMQSKLIIMIFGTLITTVVQLALILLAK